MTELRNKLKSRLAALEWRFRRCLHPFLSISEYEIWAKERRRLFERWGYLSTSKMEGEYLESLKNKYHGKRIFIIGNGPSLNSMNLDCLRNEYTFGVNRIYLLFDKITWKPSFYTVNDWEVGPDNACEINALSDMTFFFPKRFQGLFKPRDNTYWYNSRNSNFIGESFSYDVTDGAIMGGSVLHLAIQIAFYMGFDPIYLIGVDADYKILETVDQSGQKFPDGNSQFLKSTQDDDPNHFDKSYFGKGRRWHNPNLDKMIEGFSACRYAIEAKGGRLYNATLGGNLEVLERVEFHKIFQETYRGRNPSISIIMPVFNAERYISAAIQSVIEQTYRDWELIIINDGSTDRTKDIILDFDDHRIKTLDQSNKGRASARNYGLSIARGVFIAFLDADDSYMPAKLEEQIAFLRANHSIGAISGSVQRVDEEGHLLKTEVSWDSMVQTEDFLMGNPVLLQSTLFRRRSLKNITFDEKAEAGEDWKFNIQASLSGCVYFCEPKVVCTYRSTPEARNKTSKKYCEAMVDTISGIFDNELTRDSQHQSLILKHEAIYRVKIRMITRLFAVKKWNSGNELIEKYWCDFSEHTFQINDDIANGLAFWLIHFGVNAQTIDLNEMKLRISNRLDSKYITKLITKRLRIYHFKNLVKSIPGLYQLYFRLRSLR